MRYDWVIQDELKSRVAAVPNEVLKDELDTLRFSGHSWKIHVEEQIRGIFRIRVSNGYRTLLGEDRCKEITGIRSSLGQSIAYVTDNVIPLVEQVVQEALAVDIGADFVEEVRKFAPDVIVPVPDDDEDEEDE